MSSVAESCQPPSTWHSRRSILALAVPRRLRYSRRCSGVGAGCSRGGVQRGGERAVVGGAGVHVADLRPGAAECEPCQADCPDWGLGHPLIIKLLRSAGLDSAAADNACGWRRWWWSRVGDLSRLDRLPDTLRPLAEYLGNCILEDSPRSSFPRKRESQGMDTCLRRYDEEELPSGSSCM